MKGTGVCVLLEFKWKRKRRLDRIFISQIKKEESKQNVLQKKCD